MKPVGSNRGLVRKVCYENAAQLYRWPSPPAELIEASSVGPG